MLRVDEAKAPVVSRAHQLAAPGSTAWEVAAPTGLAKTHVPLCLSSAASAVR